MPSKPDTFAEVVDYLNRLAEWNHSESPQHRMLIKAASLLAAAGEEVRGWRKRNAITDPRKYERALSDVVPLIEATNALAPELENDHAG